MTDQLTQQQREAMEALDYVSQAEDAISGLYQFQFSAEVQKLLNYILNSTPTQDDSDDS